MFLAYADALLCQIPCFRMNNNTRRNQLYLDPNLKGIIYHTIKFCDYYGFEYASIKKNIKVPLLKIENGFYKSERWTVTDENPGICRND